MSIDLIVNIAAKLFHKNETLFSIVVMFIAYGALALPFSWPMYTGFKGVLKVSFFKIWLTNIALYALDFYLLGFIDTWVNSSKLATLFFLLVPICLLFFLHMAYYANKLRIQQKKKSKK